MNSGLAPSRQSFPKNFQAYARILRRVNVGQTPVLRWADVAAEKKTLVHPEAQFHSKARTGLYESVVINGFDQGSPACGELDELQLAALAAILQAHTATPESIYQGVWDGWGGFDPGVTAGVPCIRAGKLNVAHGLRQYFVFHGTSGDLPARHGLIDGLTVVVALTDKPPTRLGQWIGPGARPQRSTLTPSW